MTQGYIYILTGDKHRTLYIGVTSNLVQRVAAHKLKKIPGFSKRYNLSRLVYYEAFENITEAINREKQLKRWRRSWKIELITNFNPDWKDLYGDVEETIKQKIHLNLRQLSVPPQSRSQIKDANE